MAPTRLTLGDRVVDFDQRAVLQGGLRTALTTTESDVLRYLADHRNRPVEREELHREVWNFGPSVLSRALDTTIRRLRKKLEDTPHSPRFL